MCKYLWLNSDIMNQMYIFEGESIELFKRNVTPKLGNL